MDPSWQSNNQLIVLPELKILTHGQSNKFRYNYQCLKESDYEVCPKCAVKSYSVHDRRWVNVKDQPVRGMGVKLQILKRRFRCPTCKKVFTEPVSGIRKGFKTTERFRRGLKWACENFKNLKRVQRAYACSAGLVYKVFYEQLELKNREKMNDPWGTTLGIDEHTWKKRRGKKRQTEFASLIVDYDRERIAEVVNGKTVDNLKAQLDHIPGRERVRDVTIDMCDPFKKFVREFFPNAKITADKLYIVILPHILKKKISDTTICTQQGGRVDLEVLKRKISTYRTDGGKVRKVNDELLIEILNSWEHWTGPADGFYKALGVSRNGISSIIGKAKKLRREGFPMDGFKEIKVEESPSNLTSLISGPCQGVELLWDNGKLIRFPHVEQLIDFLKKVA